MKQFDLDTRLALWGIDPPPRDPKMLLDFIEGLAEKRLLPPPARSVDELYRRRDGLRLHLLSSLGLDPRPKRTPLNVRQAGTVERKNYVIIKLVYEAWPGLPVTAHLYMPVPLEKPAPGLVFACGHGMESGKLTPVYQSFCASAATLGIVTLIYDPIGQGERLGGWRDHGHLNALLLGKSQLGFMAWESIRALDLLESLPEVDPARIAMTGSSGGGLNTLFTTALEDRFCCSIPAAYPCTFFHAMQAERDLNWEDGVDVCNQVPQVMSYCEMSDIASLIIPKPLMILAGSLDRIFPIQGTRKIANDISRNYTLAGVPERFCFLEFEEEHGYRKPLREAAYGWLAYWLMNKGDGSAIPEPELDLIPDPYPIGYVAPPRATPGRVREQSPTKNPTPDSIIGFCLQPDKPVQPEAYFDRLLAEMCDNLPVNELPSESASVPAWQEKILRRIQAIIGPFPSKCSLDTHLFNQVWTDNLMAERITFESEKGITIPGYMIMPADWHCPSPFVVYAGEWGKRQGIKSGLVQELIAHGYGVLAIDVRGTGETAATDFEAATNLLMMDRPLFGQRVWDVIRGVDFIWERCYIAPQIDKGRLVVAGEGIGGMLALYAAALDERIAGAAALDIPFSYKSLLNSGANFPASVYLFNVLNRFDMAHVAACCAPRPILLRTVDGNRHPQTKDHIRCEFEIATKTFELLGALPDCFRILSPEDNQPVSNWLDRVLV